MLHYNHSEHSHTALNLADATEVVDTYADNVYEETKRKAAQLERSDYKGKTKLWESCWDMLEGRASGLITTVKGTDCRQRWKQYAKVGRFGGIVQDERDRLNGLKNPHLEELALLSSSDRADIIDAAEAGWATATLEKGPDEDGINANIIAAFERVETWIATASHGQLAKLHRKLRDRIGTMYKPRDLRGKYYFRMHPDAKPLRYSYEELEDNKPYAFYGAPCKTGLEVAAFLPHAWLVALTWIIKARVEVLCPNAQEAYLGRWKFRPTKLHPELKKRCVSDSPDTTPPSGNQATLRLGTRLPPERRYQAYLNRCDAKGKTPAQPKKCITETHNPHWLALASKAHRHK